MKKEIIRSQRLGEEYIRVEHPSGLSILLYPTPKLASTYALFATKYGSIDNSFRRSDESEFVTVPEGIAHYLEHKMFDCKDGDAFSKYAKTGANANAYTSFDKTAYLFSCTDHFEESLRILLEFVTEPYFTEASVAKEQGIIGQEIGMYDDDPDWQVYFNLLGALYQEHPLRIDIAGTVETIAKINADLLYRCYDCFYNLHNMVLSVAGNFDPDAALRLCDEILQPAAPITVERAHVSEPEAVRTHRVDVSMPVATTMFQVGFKGVSADEKTNYENQIIDEVINEIVAGEGSSLYRELYDQGLINNTFGTEVMCGRDYMALIFGGESKDPDKVYEAICREFDRLKAEGVSAADFERCKKALYGKYIGIFSSSSSIATVMMETHFFGLGAFDVLEVLSGLTLEQLEARLRENVDVNIRDAVEILEGMQGNGKTDLNSVCFQAVGIGLNHNVTLKNKCINLAMAGVEKKHYALAVPALVVIVAGAGAIGKFAVADRLIEVSRQQSAVSSLQQQVDAANAYIESLGDLQDTYAHYSYQGFTMDEAGYMNRPEVMQLLQDVVFQESWLLKQLNRIMIVV